jgi:hypothetical protein
VRLGGLPLALDIADGRDADGTTKFVLGLGEASIPYALNPPSTLAGAPAHAAAVAALGEGSQPSLMLDVPTLLALLEGIGLTSSPELAEVLPFLRAAGSVAGGGHSLSSGVERFSVVVGLHGASG